MNSVTSFIEDKLKLKVNRNKSKVDRPWRRKFLGFSFTFNMEPKIRVAKESVKRMKAKIREITSRKKPYPMAYRIKKDRKSTRLNSSHVAISYAVFCLK